MLTHARLLTLASGQQMTNTSGPLCAKLPPAAGSLLARLPAPPATALCPTLLDGPLPFCGVAAVLETALTLTGGQVKCSPKAQAKSEIRRWAPDWQLRYGSGKTAACCPPSQPTRWPCPVPHDTRGRTCPHLTQASTCRWIHLAAPWHLQTGGRCHLGAFPMRQLCCRLRGQPTFGKKTPLHSTTATSTK